MTAISSTISPVATQPHHAKPASRSDHIIDDAKTGLFWGAGISAGATLLSFTSGGFLAGAAKDGLVGAITGAGVGLVAGIAPAVYAGVSGAATGAVVGGLWGLATS